MRNRFFIIRLSLFCFLGLFSWIAFQGCSSGQIDDSDPKALYEEAQDDIESDRYLIALDRLRIVKNKFPYSKYSVLAQLRIADVYFLQESFAEAAAAYELFTELHPKHEKTSYAHFRMAESYFEDTPGNIARDLSAARHALESFHSFVVKYPDDKRIGEAKKRIADIRTTLAEKELYIGNFYYVRDHYESAIPRFKKVIELYPETPSAEEAKKRLEKSLKEVEGRG